MPKFVNPYTFIPLGTPLGNLETPEEQKLTGVIRCRLVTKTKLIVPDASDDPTYLPFFKVQRDGKEYPAIPGSSLRGMTRSVFEAITNSCMRANPAHDQMLQSIGGLKRPGLLYWSQRGGGYVLLQAERCKVWNEDMVAACHTGQLLDFSWRSAEAVGGNRIDNVKVVTGIACEGSTEPSANDILQAEAWGADDAARGVFLRVNKMMHQGHDHPVGAEQELLNPKHHTSHPSIFVKGAYVGGVDNSYIEAFAKNLEQYKDNNPDSDCPSDYLSCFNRLRTEHEGVLPVWYAKQGNSYQFSHARLSRSVYTKTVNSIYTQLGLGACPRAGRVCPACSLFGFVSPDGDGACGASRVRFSDAMVERDEWGNYGVTWLPELLQPHTSSFEFYFRMQPGEGRFTPEQKNAQLAGRKAYWSRQAKPGDVNHSEVVANGPITSEGDHKPLNAQAEYVPAGVSFLFDVYLDGVSRRELHQLLHALTFGDYLEEDEGLTHCHKLGRAKPYGFGSVHISLCDHGVLLRSLEEGFYYVDEADLQGDCAPDGGYGLNDSALKALRVVSRFEQNDAIGNYPIRYPYTEGGDESIFEWFGKNREQMRPELPLYHQVLASPLDASSVLDTY